MDYAPNCYIVVYNVAHMIRCYYFYIQGTVLIKSASELKSFSKGEEDQIEQV